MSTGPGKDVPTSDPEKRPADAADDLVTSEQLFGDLIDEPLEPQGGAAPAARSTPIRVQIDAGESEPARPKTAQLLPEDMSGLLDAFGDSAGAPADEPDTGTVEASDAPEAAEAELDIPIELESEAPVPVAVAAPEPVVSEPAPPEQSRPELVAARAAAKTVSPLAGQDEDFSGLLDSMAPTAPEPAPAPAPVEALSPPEPSALEPEPPAVELSLEEEDDDDSKTLAPGRMKAPVFDEPPPGLVELDGLVDDLDDAGAKTLAPGKLKAPVFDARPPEVAPAPPPARPKTALPPTDLDELLEGVFGDATSGASAKAKEPASGEPVPGLDDLMKSVPQPASRMGTRFQAAAPSIAASGESRMMLDLAGLAEDALTAPPPSEPSSSRGTGAGDDFGPYHLLEKVAAGGMAEVFRAKRAGVEGFEKIVALKRILPHLSDNKEFVDMFIDEAKMVAGLTHPNIVQIFDLGKIEQTYFIAMEYVHGRDLRTILRRTRDKAIRIPIDLAVLITGRVAAALEYAHRKKDEAGRPLRIVHRDVSPQNILIAFEGEVKLTDFGIAKATSKATSTDRGALRGKLLYMSPEQATGKAMDKRADVFSLGVCFYEMVTDRKPFMGTSEKSILEMVRECRVTPPSSVNVRVPERVERVVMKALERDPEQRYQDAGDMMRDLERALPERQPATALELSRFLEVLFEREERGDMAPPEEHAAEEARSQAADHLEIDLDVDADEAAPLASEAEPAKESGPAEEQAGFGRLLRKFGIK